MLTTVTRTADHVGRNRTAWDRWAADYAGPGLRNWATPEPMWGICNVAEAQAGVLPGDLESRDRPTAGPFRAAVPADPRQREQVPFADACFDLAISEYGASI